MESLEKLLERKPLSPAEAVKKLNTTYVEELGLKNLARDERIVFRVIQKPIKATNTQGEHKEIYKASQRVPNKCEVFDGKEMFEISYPEEISFYRDSGSEIVITGKEPNKFPLLWFLRMSNHNLSNPSAIKGSEYIFEEVAEHNNSQNAFDKEVEIASFISVIKQKCLADISQMCKQFNIGTGETLVEKQMAMIGFIKNDLNRQKFATVVINMLGSCKELIAEATKLDLLALDNDTKIWSRRMDGETHSEIIQVPIGEDPKDYLVKYFTTNERGKKLKTFFEAKTSSILAGRKADQVKGI